MSGQLTIAPTLPTIIIRESNGMVLVAPNVGRNAYVVLSCESRDDTYKYMYV